MLASLCFLSLSISLLFCFYIHTKKKPPLLKKVVQSISKVQSSVLLTWNPVYLFSVMMSTQRSMYLCRWCKKEPCFVYVLSTIFSLMVAGINWIYCPLKYSHVPKSLTEKHIKLKVDSSIALSLLVIPHMNNNLSLSTFPKIKNWKGTVRLHQLLLTKYILTEKLHIVENKTSTMKTSVMQHLLKVRWVTTQKVIRPQRNWKAVSLTIANSWDLKECLLFWKEVPEIGLAFAESAL